MKRAWDRFWFAPVTYQPLPLLRISLPLHYVFYSLDTDLGGLLNRGAWPPEYLVPSFPVRLLPFPIPFPTEWLPLYYSVMAVSGMLAAVGLFTRPALAIFTVGYMYLKGFMFSWGSLDHESSSVALTLLILTVAPGVTVGSLDALLGWLGAQRRGQSSSLVSYLAPRPVSRWGLQLILCVMVMGYFGAGASKLRHGGVRWLNGQTLSFYMSGKSDSSKLQQYGGERVPRADCLWRDGFGIDFVLLGARRMPAYAYIENRPALLPLLGTMSVGFELLSIVILFGGAYRSLYLLAAFVFHAGVYSLMYVAFWTWMLMDILLLDWQWIADRLRRKWGPP